MIPEQKQNKEKIFNIICLSLKLNIYHLKRKKNKRKKNFEKNTNFKMKDWQLKHKVLYE